MRVCLLVVAGFLPRIDAGADQHLRQNWKPHRNVSLGIADANADVIREGRLSIGHGIKERWEQRQHASCILHTHIDFFLVYFMYYCTCTIIHDFVTC